MAAPPPVGRFAPSPTGDLHFGSLLAALASYCETRSRGGQWQLRIDDIDGPRSVPGSATAIQSSLKLYGFVWDGPVRWQSQNQTRYTQALAELVSQQRVFVCGCSRRQLPAGGIYPGTCRNNILKSIDQPVHDRALRLRLPDERPDKRPDEQIVNDGIQGNIAFDLATDCGDIIIWRRDQLVSYSLACAVDDATDVTEVVRGADLLGSTGAQLAIMQYLDLPPPRYAHIPVAIDANDDKLSKHSKAPAISSLEPVATLMQAWNFLGQDAMAATSINQFWANAIRLWNLQKVPALTRCQL